ncbi:MAG: type II toxin-antitoxin system PemK/MazF family toxin [Lachnospiraceae bacterium]|nr:type II toxin-antitoxin system PemK/MazF family toxin [Lachnospiraceae bacterium]
MSSRSGQYGTNNHYVCSTLKQGDIILVNFGNRCEGSRNLYGKRPVYVLSNNADDKSVGVLMVVPMFRTKSRDNAGNDVEIRPIDCPGLRYPEYAQTVNIQKIRKHQIIKRIGRVKNGAVHSELLASMWEQVGQKDGR